MSLTYSHVSGKFGVECVAKTAPSRWKSAALSVKVITAEEGKLI